MAPPQQQQVCVFPTVISSGLFDRAAELNPVFEAEVRRLLATSAVSKTQTHDRIHAEPVFAPLVAFIEDQIAARFEAFRYRDCGFFIACCWANVQERGDALKYHSHANSFLSGTYYVKATPEAGDIEFLDPRATGYRYDIETTEMNLYNGEAFSIRPRPGVLLLFPSSVMHGVGVNRSGEERISISFNVMVRGRLGATRRLTRLEI